MQTSPCKRVSHVKHAHTHVCIHVHVHAPIHAYSHARSQDCQRDTRIEAKAKLLGIVPQELKRIIGHDTAKRGMLGCVE